MILFLWWKDSGNFEIQIIDEGGDLGHDVGGEVLGDFPGNRIRVVRLFRSGTEWIRWNGRDLLLMIYLSTFVTCIKRVP